MGASKDVLTAFIQCLASGFLEAAKEITSTTGPKQEGRVASTEARPGSYDSWVALLCSILEDNGVDIDLVFNSSGAAADGLAAAGESDEEVEDEPEALSPAQVWAESETEAVLDRLISKKTLIELPDMPFHPGVKVFAVLTDDDQWHPAVILREVAFADMWENGSAPHAPGDVAVEAGPERCEDVPESKTRKEKKTKKPKAIDTHSAFSRIASLKCDLSNTARHSSHATTSSC